MVTGGSFRPAGDCTGGVFDRKTQSVLRISGHVHKKISGRVGGKFS